MTEIKRCKDCNHFDKSRTTQAGYFGARCRRPLGEDPVYNGKLLAHCSPLEERQTGECGMEAKFFERKPPKPLGFMEKFSIRLFGAKD